MPLGAQGIIDAINNGMSVCDIKSYINVLFRNELKSLEEKIHQTYSGKMLDHVLVNLQPEILYRRHRLDTLELQHPEIYLIESGKYDLIV